LSPFGADSQAAKGIRTARAGEWTATAVKNQNLQQNLQDHLGYVNQTLLAWAMRKFKRFSTHKIRASQFLQRLARLTGWGW
jgi:hypothetical protein